MKNEDSFSGWFRRWTHDQNVRGLNLHWSNIKMNFTSTIFRTNMIPISTRPNKGIDNEISVSLLRFLCKVRG